MSEARKQRRKFRSANQFQQRIEIMQMRAVIRLSLKNARRIENQMNRTGA